MDYIEALQKAEFFDYSQIRGCYVLRPNSYEIWEIIKDFLNKRFKKLGIKNAYFPMFVTKKALEMEKEHISGFSPELMYVSGKCKLSDEMTSNATTEHEEHEIAIRPTSEAIISEYFAKWITSHKQLPFKINQFCNVVRCEDKSCTPFLRSVEILWHEMHSIHKTQEDAQKFVLTMLNLYEELYENILAVPVIKGRKTELEKFAGAIVSETIECFIPSTGKAIQAATSHNLGYSFGKMFGILYDTEDMRREIPCQVSAGLTTRSIGVMVLTHMDEKGVVLPPNVAPTQIVVIPIYNKKVDTNELLAYTNQVVIALQNMNLRVELDDKKEYTPGWKYNYYEGLGTPLRVEVGMNDLKNQTFRIAKRYNSQKEDIEFVNIEVIPSILEHIQNEMLRLAKEKLDTKIVTCTNFADFETQIKDGMMVITPWKESSESEEKIKAVMKDMGENIKTLCKPYYLNTCEVDQCFFTGEIGTCYVMWGKSY